MSEVIVQGMNGYGVTHEYTIKIRNLYSKTRKFSYVTQGQDVYISYSANGNKTDLELHRAPEWLPCSTEVFCEEIVPGEEITLAINIILMTGSNPVMHNAFVIDGDINEEKIYENESDDSPSYTGYVYDNFVVK